MKRTAKIYNIILSMIFLAIIGFCYWNELFHFYKVPEKSVTENRNLTKKPVFDINLLDPFPKAYEAYFNDQFPFRKELGFLNTLIRFFYLNQSPLPGEVELGIDGWLFFDQKESEIFQGKNKLTEKHARMIARTLHERTLIYRKKGIKFYVAFGPMKPEIYPEYLPVDFKRSPDGTFTDKVVNAISGDSIIQFIDLKKVMLDSKRHGQLYYKTDNHWNWIGAFYAYDGILRRINKDFPKVEPLKRFDISFRALKSKPGNLGTMIGLYDYLSEVDYYPIIKNPRSVILNTRHPRPEWAKEIDNYEYNTATGDTKLPKIVVIRDSYTDAMMKYMDESFNSTTYIFDGWKYLENEAIIDDVKPEIVLLVIFEPHIYHLLGKW